MRKGIADIRGTYQGRSLSIEVKIGQDRLSEVQKLESERITNAGGLAFVATSFPQFLLWFMTNFPELKEKLLQCVRSINMMHGLRGISNYSLIL